MKKIHCDMCNSPVEGNIAKDVKCGSKFAGHHVAVSVTISTDGDYCLSCLLDSKLRRR